MVQTKQARETEVEGEATVSLPPEVEEGLAAEDNQGENETTPQEEIEQPQEPDQQEEEQPVEVTSQPEKPRTQKRFGSLIDKLKETTDKNSELQKQLEQLRNGSQDPFNQPQQGNLPPWQQDNFAPLEGDITPEQYEQHVISKARNLTQVELAKFQQNMRTYEDLREDSQYVKSNYPDIFDPNAEGYNAEAEKKIVSRFNQLQKADPSVRLKDYVDEVMSFQKSGEETGKRQVTETYIKQQQESAVPPTGTSGSRNEQTDWDSMNLKEKEQYMKDNGIWSE